MRSDDRIDGRTLVLLGAMYAIIVGNAALYYTRPLPLAVHVLLGALGIHLAFTVWHEAVHENLSRGRWVNELVGVLAMLPYMAPYFLGKWIHLEHHRRLNTEQDPNLVYAGGSLLTLPLRYARALRYPRRVLTADPRTRGERFSDRVTIALVVAVYGVALARGMLLDVLVLWLVPFVLAKLTMDWYINWLPHVGLPPDRYRGTRIIDVAWLTPLVLLHNYHAVHHLWPALPWYRYRATFRAKLSYLQDHGVPIDHRVAAAWSQRLLGATPLVMAPSEPNQPESASGKRKSDRVGVAEPYLAPQGAAPRSTRESSETP
jgi:beta-carotene hydroxylase